MRASQTNKPLPLPLPPPPLSLPSTPSTTPRRRGRTASSSSWSSSVSAGSSSSPSPSPAPSPRTTTATSVVPFSWERRPGLPKSSLGGLMSSSGSSTTLPLPPPPLRPSPRRCRQRRRCRAVEAPGPGADPFAAALVECTREEGMDDDDSGDKLWPARTAKVSGRTARPWRIAGGGVVGLLDLYGCKSAMDVVDGAFLARRPVAPSPRPGPCRAIRR
ncbi:translation initiation factor IF-2-like [Lolium rigidum]|uniref:translation initiation factor IF-2-like n=1 Tax=Lolium rigidum TaxID=89674 RepID=UPI001F5D3334|nr:translation initiation factor IF-2-like [Lolium rigidum]